MRAARLFLALLACALAAPVFAQCPVSTPVQGEPPPGPLPVFPADNWWNIDISNAPVDPNSATYINFIGPTKGMHPDFGGEAGGDDIYGIPYAIVDGAQEKLPVSFEVWDESDGVNMDTGEGVPFYPIPVEAIDQAHWIEGGPAGTVDLRGDSDRHLIMVDCTNRHLYELYNVWYDEGTSQWYAYSGAFFDLDTNDRRPETWTSADASGMAIFPGLVRYDEAADDERDDLGHAIRMTTRDTNGYVYPASHDAGNGTNAPPLGARLRLKKLVNGLDPVDRTNDPIARRILRTMQKYGLIIADNGSDMYFTGTFDTRWDNGILNPAFSAIKASDFEVIQLGYDPSAIGQLSVSDAEVTEGNAGTKNLAFLVSLSMPHAVPVTFNVVSGSGTATAGVDYVALAQNGVSIPAGQQTKIVNVVVNGDTTIEPNETLNIAISNATAPIDDPNGFGVIINDDAPVMAIADASVSEGHSGTKNLNFTVSLSRTSPLTVSANFKTTGSGTATAGVDYTAVALGSVSFAPGATTAIASVPIAGDTAIENNETLVVSLFQLNNATMGDGSALGTIVDDDLPKLTILDRSYLTEGNAGTSVAAFTVKLSEAAPWPVSVDLSTGTGGTATSGVDYVAADVNAMVFQPGQTAKAFNVTINGDTAIENQETFVARIDAATGAAIADGSALGTIINDDFPSLSIADHAVLEGNSGTKQSVFTIIMSEAAPFTVIYGVGTGQEPGGAEPGVDYEQVSAQYQQIPPGQLAKTFSVPIFGDTTIEPDEIFKVALISHMVPVTDGIAIGTITSDDKPVLTIADVAITEGNSGTKNAVFTVSISQQAPYPVTFNIATTGAGTATAGVDYVAKSLSGLQIPPGMVSKTVAVTLNGDTIVEPNETYVVAVTGVTGANVGDGSALGTITNDD
jgi:hypothetical protein